MEQAVEGTQQGRQPAGPGAAATRSGQSGEGARSALEHLIQQERKRDAQRPREGGSPPDPAPGS